MGVVSTFFRVERDEVLEAEARIKRVLALNDYFSFVFDKYMLEAKPAELDILERDHNRFNTWKQRRGTQLTFEELKSTIQYLRTHL